MFDEQAVASAAGRFDYPGRELGPDAAAVAGGVVGQQMADPGVAAAAAPLTRLDGIIASMRGHLTLEGAVLEERVNSLREDATKLSRRRAFLREERRRARRDEQYVEEAKKHLAYMQEETWFPSAYVANAREFDYVEEPARRGGNDNGVQSIEDRTEQQQQQGRAGAEPEEANAPADPAPEEAGTGAGAGEEKQTGNEDAVGDRAPSPLTRVPMQPPPLPEGLEEGQQQPKQWRRVERPRKEEKRLKFNIGGQLFELGERFARRDPYSVLAALCDDHDPLPTEQDGVLFLDRDWWLFRYVLKFLRDGDLPEDRTLLAQLYKEASFWKLETLKRAIEQGKLQLYRADWEAPEAPEDWWQHLPNWWAARDELRITEQQAEEEERERRIREQDWWAGTHYKGRDYSKMPNADKRDKADQEKPGHAYEGRWDESRSHGLGHAHRHRHRHGHRSHHPHSQAHHQHRQHHYRPHQPYHHVDDGDDREQLLHVYPPGNW